MDLCQVVPDLNLYDPDWPMPSRQPHRPPAKFVFDDAGRRGMAVDSLVSGGCIVSGALVRRSILFRECLVAEGSVLDESLILPRVRIGRNVRLRRAIIDKDCVLPDGFSVGFDAARDRRRFHVTEGGVTLVTAKEIVADDDSRPI
jgi:glucose-1-phosphate adenylyltransferase